jgi:hypothetical protein
VGGGAVSGAGSGRFRRFTSQEREIDAERDTNESNLPTSPPSQTIVEITESAMPGQFSDPNGPGSDSHLTVRHDTICIRILCSRGPTLQRQVHRGILRAASRGRAHLAFWLVRSSAPRSRSTSRAGLHQWAARTVPSRRGWVRRRCSSQPKHPHRDSGSSTTREW